MTQRDQEWFLKLWFDTEPSARSPYAINGNPPMWETDRFADFVLYTHPKKTQMRPSPGLPYQEVDGVSYQWQRDGKWIDQGVSCTFDRVPVVPSLDLWEASVKSRFPGSVFFVHLSRDDLKLDSLIVPKGDRKRGVGSAIMEELADYADRLGRRVILSVGQKDDGHGTTSRARLVEFYKRFGFVENKGRRKDFTIMEGMFRCPEEAAGHRPPVPRG